MIISSIAFIVTVLLLVGIHEFGHYVFARMFGVKVHTFSIGFGSTVIEYHTDSTTFKLSAIPLGGYVELAGATVESALFEEPKDCLIHKPAWQQFIINAGGILFNILSIYLILIPYLMIDQDFSFVKAVGVCIFGTLAIPYVMYQAVLSIWAAPAEAFMGPSEAVESMPVSSWYDYGKNFILYSASLVIFNLLPIPPLDGWNMVMNFIHMITGRPVNERINKGFKIAGAVLMIILTVFVLGKDVYKLIFQ